jgi:hypothetical protein
MDTNNLMDLILKWILVVGYFLLLVSLFRGRLMVEGTPGYLGILLVIAPLNLAWGGYVQNHQGAATGPVLVGGAFLLNSALLLIFTKLTPGMSALGLKPILLFAALFSLCTLGMHHVLVQPVGTWG